MLNREQVELQQEQLREQVAELPQEQRQRFYQHWQKQVKDPDSYAVLNYLLLAGLHHFYLGKWQRGAINLLVSLVAILLITLGIWFVGMGLLAAITLVELPALFRSELVVLDHNNKRMQQLLEQVKST
ncbi:TM2 domain-containing protein [Agarivorans aestuarii]|uniref:TM2 domain-containing protein n=1 Tax=Agarivorans aestuarii TaxID=1563703 RepID=A0ABU7G8H6_9ALTE|nr:MULTISPECIES: TM2 domain-containing protein [Agarivorans]MEE1675703.1 TM2 domain-containing protein [Agarivorans aestuarii]